MNYTLKYVWEPFTYYKILSVWIQNLIYEFNKKSLIGKVIFVFETLCFEKISMLTINEMKELTYRYFKTGEIIKISKYEYIYIGIK